MEKEGTFKTAINFWHSKDEDENSKNERNKKQTPRESVSSVPPTLPKPKKEQCQNSVSTLAVAKESHPLPSISPDETKSNIEKIESELKAAEIVEITQTVAPGSTINEMMTETNPRVSPPPVAPKPKRFQSFERKAVSVERNSKSSTPRSASVEHKSSSLDAKAQIEDSKVNVSERRRVFSNQKSKSFKPVPRSNHISSEPKIASSMPDVQSSNDTTLKSKKEGTSSPEVISRKPCTTAPKREDTFRHSVTPENEGGISKETNKASSGPKITSPMAEIQNLHGKDTLLKSNNEITSSPEVISKEPCITAPKREYTFRHSVTPENEGGIAEVTNKALSGPKITSPMEVQNFHGKDTLLKSKDEVTPSPEVISQEPCTTAPKREDTFRHSVATENEGGIAVETNKASGLVAESTSKAKTRIPSVESTVLFTKLEEKKSDPSLEPKISTDQPNYSFNEIVSEENPTTKSTGSKELVEATDVQKTKGGESLGIRPSQSERDHQDLEEFEFSFSKTRRLMRRNKNMDEAIATKNCTNKEIQDPLRKEARKELDVSSIMHENFGTENLKVANEAMANDESVVCKEKFIEKPPKITTEIMRVSLEPETRQNDSENTAGKSFLSRYSARSDKDKPTISEIGQPNARVMKKMEEEQKTKRIDVDDYRLKSPTMESDRKISQLVSITEDVKEDAPKTGDSRDRSNKKTEEALIDKSFPTNQKHNTEEQQKTADSTSQPKVSKAEILGPFSAEKTAAEESQDVIQVENEEVNDVKFKTAVGFWQSKADKDVNRKLKISNTSTTTNFQKWHIRDSKARSRGHDESVTKEDALCKGKTEGSNNTVVSNDRFLGSKLNTKPQKKSLWSTQRIKEPGLKKGENLRNQERTKASPTRWNTNWRRDTPKTKEKAKNVEAERPERTESVNPKSKESSFHYIPVTFSPVKESPVKKQPSPKWRISEARDKRSPSELPTTEVTNKDSFKDKCQEQGEQLASTKEVKQYLGEYRDKAEEPVIGTDGETVRDLVTKSDASKILAQHEEVINKFTATYERLASVTKELEIVKPLNTASQISPDFRGVDSSRASSPYFSSVVSSTPAKNPQLRLPRGTHSEFHRNNPRGDLVQAIISFFKMNKWLIVIVIFAMASLVLFLYSIPTRCVRPTEEGWEDC